MAAFEPGRAFAEQMAAGSGGEGRWTVLVRNHEIGTLDGAFVRPAYDPVA